MEVKHTIDLLSCYGEHVSTQLPGHTFIWSSDYTEAGFKKRSDCM